jgi:hypothetical protein
MVDEISASLVNSIVEYTKKEMHIKNKQSTDQTEKDEQDAVIASLNTDKILQKIAHNIVIKQSGDTYVCEKKSWFRRWTGFGWLRYIFRTPLKEKTQFNKIFNDIKDGVKKGKIQKNTQSEGVVKLLNEIAQKRINMALKYESQLELISFPEEKPAEKPQEPKVGRSSASMSSLDSSSRVQEKPQPEEPHAPANESPTEQPSLVAQGQIAPASNGPVQPLVEQPQQPIAVEQPVVVQPAPEQVKVPAQPSLAAQDQSAPIVSVQPPVEQPQQPIAVEQPVPEAPQAAEEGVVPEAPAAPPLDLPTKPTGQYVRGTQIPSTEAQPNAASPSTTAQEKIPPEKTDFQLQLAARLAKRKKPESTALGKPQEVIGESAIDKINTVNTNIKNAIIKLGRTRGPNEKQSQLFTQHFRDKQQQITDWLEANKTQEVLNDDAVNAKKANADDLYNRIQTFTKFLEDTRQKFTAYVTSYNNNTNKLYLVDPQDVQSHLFEMIDPKKPMGALQQEQDDFIKNLKTYQEVISRPSGQPPRKLPALRGPLAQPAKQSPLKPQIQTGRQPGRVVAPPGLADLLGAKDKAKVGPSGIAATPASQPELLAFQERLKKANLKKDDLGSLKIKKEDLKELDKPQTFDAWLKKQLPEAPPPVAEAK